MKSLTGSRKRLGLLQEAARFMQKKDTGLSVSGCFQTDSGTFNTGMHADYQ